MNVLQFESKENFVSTAVDLVIEEIDKKPNLLLCAATGSSPLPIYRKLVDNSRLNPDRYKSLRLIKLDEWVGLKSKEGSCETYLRNELLDPLKIDDENYFAFNEETENPKEECTRIQNLLEAKGPIDLCILGLGKNGHLGFNEPPAVLTQKCHVARLTTQSQQHNMVLNQTEKPEFGMTLGIRDILSAKRILLLISGSGKEKAKQQFLASKVDPQCPASFLWLHANVDCLIMDED
ncbi:galactosamine-6-phosphate isomerase [Flagellimonas sp.]|uniref:galactosamine-6-phosphate isomerase n=1 Tax=Flagellimonas sp. TaxID=2058762 RepID=UPI003B5C73CA